MQEKQVDAVNVQEFAQERQILRISSRLFAFEENIKGDAQLVIGLARAKRLLLTKCECFIETNVRGPFGYNGGRELANAIWGLQLKYEEVPAFLTRKWASLEQELLSSIKGLKGENTWTSEIFQDTVLFTGCHLLCSVHERRTDHCKITEDGASCPPVEQFSRLGYTMITRWDQFRSPGSFRVLEKERRIFCLVAKVPKAGRSKTRLARAIGDSAAVQFAEACILDLCERLACMTDVDERILLFAPVEERDEFNTFLSKNLSDQVRSAWRLEPFLTGENSPEEIADGFVFKNDELVGLGRGLCRAIRAVRGRSAKGRLVFIGMDTPQLGQDLIERAFATRTCEDWDAMIAPAKDGGYVLLSVAFGDKDFEVVDAFSNITWSSPLTLAMQAGSLYRAGLHRIMVEGSTIHQDVDELEDLAALNSFMNASTPEQALRQHRSFLCPRVVSFLKEYYGE